MIKLPYIPYSMPKNKSQEITIRGLNLGSMPSPGDVVNSKNLSLSKYPFVTAQRTAEEVIAGNTTALTSFMGNLVTIKDEKLHTTINGTEVSFDGYTEADHTFAAINTKLTVFPEKKYITKDEEVLSSNDLGYSEKARLVFSDDKVLGSISTIQEVASGYGGTLINKRFDCSSEQLFYDACVGETKNAEKKLIGCIDEKEKYSLTLQSNPRGSLYYELPENGSKDFMKDEFAIGSIFYLSCTGANAHYSNFYKVKTFIYHGTSKPYNLEIWATTVGDSAQVDFPSNLSNSVIYTRFNPYFAFHSSSAIKLSSNELFTAEQVENENILYLDDKKQQIQIGKYDNVSVIKWDKSIRTSLEMASGIDKTYVSLIFPRKSLVFSGVAAVNDYGLIFDEPQLTGISQVSADLDEKVYVISGIVGHFDNKIKPLDVVEVSNCTIDGVETNNTAVKINRIENDFLCAAAEIFTPGLSDGAVTIQRKIPDLDFICEKDNRLYGCSNKDNTIYVSALGDPTNMYAYEGISTDAYAVAVGSDGDFTGCCKYGSSVLFFKENMIYKLTGSYPAEYALYSYSVDGVQEGCNESLVTINEILYYKGKRGVFAYGGDLPTLISESFGDKKFKDAAAGTDGESYYISMVDEQDKPYLFSYNTRLGIWLIEGNIKCDSFTRLDNDVYYISEGNVYKLHANDDSNVEWLVQYAPIYETIEGKKTQSRLLIRAEIPRGSYLIVKMRCDDGAWVEVGKVAGKCSGVVPLRIPINRCDKFELKFEGKGKITFQSMLREFYIGSDK